MAERRFDARTLVAAGPETVFEWVADYRNVPRVLSGVSRWRPLGARTRGRGARFDVRLRAFGLPLEATLVLDAWEAPRSIGWRSESGPLPHAGRWRFEARPEGTEVT